MLTTSAKRLHKLFYVIGVRASGDRIVIEAYRRQRDAEAFADRCRRELEDYVDISVEPNETE